MGGWVETEHWVSDCPALDAHMGVVWGKPLGTGFENEDDSMRRVGEIKFHEK